MIYQLKKGDTHLGLRPRRALLLGLINPNSNLIKSK